MSDTVTLELQGSVSLAQFADAVSHFNRLMTALSDESKAEYVRWEVSDLEISSTIATARGIAENGATPEQIEEVVSSYLEVGRALEQDTTIPYSGKVQQEAKAITAVLGAGVSALRFETAESDAIVREARAPKAPPEITAESTAAYGAVTGRVQTLTSRNALRFTLYDHIYDRAVSCYLAEGQEDLMREMWDKLATVEGWVTRDAPTGRPLAVRQIMEITRLPESGPQDYMAARGMLPLKKGDLKPEDAIRRLRDAG